MALIPGRTLNQGFQCSTQEFYQSPHALLREGAVRHQYRIRHGLQIHASGRVSSCAHRGIAMEVSKSHAHICEIIDVRCTKLITSITTQRTISKVIRHDENDVWQVLGLRSCGYNLQAKKDSQFPR